MANSTRFLSYIGLFSRKASEKRPVVSDQKAFITKEYFKGFFEALLKRCAEKVAETQPNAAAVSAAIEAAIFEKAEVIYNNFLIELKANDTDQPNPRKNAEFWICANAYVIAARMAGNKPDLLKSYKNIEPNKIITDRVLQPYAQEYAAALLAHVDRFDLREIIKNDLLQTPAPHSSIRAGVR